MPTIEVDTDELAALEACVRLLRDVRARCADEIQAYGDRRAAEAIKRRDVETETRLRECLASEYERGKREGGGEGKKTGVRRRGCNRGRLRGEPLIHCRSAASPGGEVVSGPSAEKLADELDDVRFNSEWHSEDSADQLRMAASELRRLAAVERERDEARARVAELESAIRTEASYLRSRGDRGTQRGLQWAYDAAGRLEAALTPSKETT